MFELAYVDPGLGLLAWQSVVAAFVGLFFYLKKTRQWLFRLVRKPFRATRAPESGAAPGAPGELK